MNQNRNGSVMIPTVFEDMNDIQPVTSDGTIINQDMDPMVADINNSMMKVDSLYMAMQPSTNSLNQSFSNSNNNNNHNNNNNNNNNAISGFRSNQIKGEHARRASVGFMPLTQHKKPGELLPLSVLTPELRVNHLNAPISPNASLHSIPSRNNSSSSLINNISPLNPAPVLLEQTTNNLTLSPSGTPPLLIPSPGEDNLIPNFGYPTSGRSTPGLIPTGNINGLSATGNVIGKQPPIGNERLSQSHRRSVSYTPGGFNDNPLFNPNYTQLGNANKLKSSGDYFPSQQLTPQPSPQQSPLMSPQLSGISMNSSNSINSSLNNNTNVSKSSLEMTVGGGVSPTKSKSAVLGYTRRGSNPRRLHQRHASDTSTIAAMIFKEHQQQQQQQQQQMHHNLQQQVFNIATSQNAIPTNNGIISPTGTPIMSNMNLNSDCNNFPSSRHRRFHSMFIPTTGSFESNSSAISPNNIIPTGMHITPMPPRPGHRRVLSSSSVSSHGSIDTPFSQESSIDLIGRRVDGLHIWSNDDGQQMFFNKPGFQHVEPLLTNGNISQSMIPIKNMNIPFGTDINQSITNTKDETDEGNGPQQCHWNGCSLIFQDRSILVEHISSDHVGSGKAEYICEWKDCNREGRPFLKRHKIRNHVRIHTGERPFVCTYPGCGKKFTRGDGLHTHMKTHAELKPFVCNQINCDKAYYHSRSLRKHLNKVHGIFVSAEEMSSLDNVINQGLSLQATPAFTSLK